MKLQSRQFLRLMSAIMIIVMLPMGNAWGAIVPPLGLLPLNQVAVPEPPNLYQFVKNKAVAIKLGKALFWDMQVGSDGMTACATCHFSAGSDSRATNTLNPGKNGTFDVKAPNQSLVAADFPFHERQTPADFQAATVVRDRDDVVGAQGVRLKQFSNIVEGSRFDAGTPLLDTVFNVNGANVRQVTGRNTPSVINAIFNFANFWDGRASPFFNGSSPFGPLDPDAGVWYKNGAILTKQKVSIQFASLASQAMGPPLNEVEMSFRGRTFPQLGKKMLSLTPLAFQTVHPYDSELGAYSRATILPDGSLGGSKGLRTTYEQMIKDAFQDNLWNSGLSTGGFTQMQANFSLFWGLAIQLYEATLVSDDTPFDHFLAGDATALTEQQQEGFNIFFGVGRCDACHGGSELTNATVGAAAFLNLDTHLLIELMPVASGKQIIYDNGYNNTGVRKTNEDVGRGADSPFLLGPLTDDRIPLSFSAQADLQLQGLLPFLAPLMPSNIPTDFPIANDGAFKVPGLRNVELTGPYMHNGGMRTLEETILFYTRGGDFPNNNKANLDINIAEIPAMVNEPDVQAAMVGFLKSFTDDRVREEAAPFDHPEIYIPDGDSVNDTAMIHLQATDEIGNKAPIPEVTVTANRTSPQATGTQITFTASIQKGVGAYEYRFSINSGAGSTVVRDYAPSVSWQMPGSYPAGSYSVQVDIRSAGLSIEREALGQFSNFQLTGPQVLTVDLTASPEAFQALGNPVLFTAVGPAPTGYEYEFWLWNGAGWGLVQGYSTTPTWQLPDTSPAGNYTVQVNIRTTGSTVEREGMARVSGYLVTSGQAISVDLAANPVTSQTAGAPALFTATGPAPTGYEYEFWLWNGAQWSLAQGYSPTSTWEMPAATPLGTYTIQANIRSAGSTVEKDASARIANYRITAPAATSVDLSATPASSQTAGNPVTFTATGHGSSGYEYEFWFFNGDSWALGREYNATDNWVMPDTTPTGTYTIQVNVRGAGSSAEKDSMTRIAEYQIVP